MNRAAAKLYPKAKPATINRQLITPISAIVTLAAEDDLCSLRKFRRRRVTDKKTRWLSPEEFERFAEFLPPHMAQIIGFMIGTGARARETLALNVSTLYFNTGQALLTDTKKGLPRMVRFPPRAAEMIGSRKLPERGRAFLTHKNRPYVIRENTGGQIKTAADGALSSGLALETAVLTQVHEPSSLEDRFFSLPPASEWPPISLGARLLVAASVLDAVDQIAEEVGEPTIENMLPTIGPSIYLLLASAALEAGDDPRIDVISARRGGVCFFSLGWPFCCAE